MSDPQPESLENQATQLRKELATLRTLKDATQTPFEKKLVDHQITTLANLLEETMRLKNTKPLEAKTKEIQKKVISLEAELTPLEKTTLKRLKKKVALKKPQSLSGPNRFSVLANKLFLSLGEKIAKAKSFEKVERAMLRSNFTMSGPTYAAGIILSGFFAFIGGIALFIFFMLFNFGPLPPFITSASFSASRMLGLMLIPILFPAGLVGFLYLYPLLEQKSLEQKINRELPFATIHMAAISGSMVNPARIFEIVTKTGEYPTISREFVKIINNINVYGYDLVNALRSVAEQGASKKLSDLLNGVATTITSGGELAQFFDKRAQTLLFEHRLEQEKETRSAETFMDIYISVVIAAPMILMLVLILMRISNIGFSLSTNFITLLMVLGVTVINVLFLVFLSIKQQKE